MQRPTCGRARPDQATHEQGGPAFSPTTPSAQRRRRALQATRGRGSRRGHAHPAADQTSRPPGRSSVSDRTVRPACIRGPRAHGNRASGVVPMGQAARPAHGARHSLPGIAVRPVSCSRTAAGGWRTHCCPTHPVNARPRAAETAPAGQRSSSAPNLCSRPSSNRPLGYDPAQWQQTARRYRDDPYGARPDCS